MHMRWTILPSCEFLETEITKHIEFVKTCKVQFFNSHNKN